MPNAMKVCCNPDGLRRRGSAVRGSSGYADRHGGCSNRNALPICATRQPRQFAAQSSCCLVKVESAACSQSLSIIMRLRIPAHPAIFHAQPLITAILEEVGRPTAGRALVTACTCDAPFFARVARGCASGPARCILGRQDEHGCFTRDAGR